MMMRWRAAAGALVVSIGAMTAGSALAQKATDGKQRRVKLLNETHVTLREFYAATPSQYGLAHAEDFLGPDVLRPGQSVVIDFDDGTNACVFDFKAVFEGGDEVVRRRINVCEITTYSYTGD